MNNLQIISTAVEVPNNPDLFCKRAKLDIGTFCNYKCDFCYYKSKLHSKTPLQVILNRFETLYNLGCRDFDLSGGEPTIHPDFIKIIEIIKKRNCKVSTLTNGSTFNNLEYLKKAKDAGLDEILFSLHSIGGIHNALVQKDGAYDRILKSIINAKSLDILTRINSIVTDGNLKYINKEFTEIIEFIKPYEVNFLPLNYFSDAKSLKYGLDYEKASIVFKEFIKHFENFEVSSSLGVSKMRINIRYYPLCYMEGFEKYVKGYYQHIFENLDWSLAFYEYKENTFENLKEQAKINRIKNYRKTENCLKCKYFFICDGIEFNNTSKEKPVSGKVIKRVEV